MFFYYSILIPVASDIIPLNNIIIVTDDWIKLEKISLHIGIWYCFRPLDMSTQVWNGTIPLEILGAVNRRQQWKRPSAQNSLFSVDTKPCIRSIHYYEGGQFRLICCKRFFTHHKPRQQLHIQRMPPTEGTHRSLHSSRTAGTHTCHPGG